MGKERKKQKRNGGDLRRDSQAYWEARLKRIGLGEDAKPQGVPRYQNVKCG